MKIMAIDEKYWFKIIRVQIPSPVLEFTADVQVLG